VGTTNWNGTKRQKRNTKSYTLSKESGEAEDYLTGIERNIRTPLKGRFLLGRRDNDEAEALFSIARMIFDFGFYDKALLDYLEGLRFYKQPNNSALSCSVLHGLYETIGNAYARQENYPESNQLLSKRALLL